MISQWRPEQSSVLWKACLSVDNRIAIKQHLHLNTNSGLKKKIQQLPGSPLDLTNMTTLTQESGWEQFCLADKFGESLNYLCHSPKLLPSTCREVPVWFANTVCSQNVVWQSHFHRYKPTKDSKISNLSNKQGINSFFLWRTRALRFYILCTI